MKSAECFLEIIVVLPTKNETQKLCYSAGLYCTSIYAQFISMVICEISKLHENIAAVKIVVESLQSTAMVISLIPTLEKRQKFSTIDLRAFGI